MIHACNRDPHYFLLLFFSRPQTSILEIRAQTFVNKENMKAIKYGTRRKNLFTNAVLFAVDVAPKDLVATLTRDAGIDTKELEHGLGIVL